jgi:hypothetical protein
MAHNPGLGGAFKSFRSRHRVGGTIIQFQWLNMNNRFAYYANIPPTKGGGRMLDQGFGRVNKPVQQNTQIYDYAAGIAGEDMLVAGRGRSPPSSFFSASPVAAVTKE